jgi:hypothetical protein
MRKPPVSELVDQNSLHFDYQGLPVLFYRAALPLSRKTLNYVAGIIRRHLKAIGSRWRKLNPGQAALLVLAYLKKGDTFAEAAAGFGVSRTTAWRLPERDRGAARGPRPEAPPGGPGREEGRSRPRDP